MGTAIPGQDTAGVQGLVQGRRQRHYHSLLEKLPCKPSPSLSDFHCAKHPSAGPPPRLLVGLAEYWTPGAPTTSTSI
ncbi:hypothetical protein WJX82_010681 [Trebouxia sp. C0006]